jgi:nitrate reductase gamma subunit
VVVEEIVCIFMPCLTAAVFLAGIVSRIKNWNRAGAARLPLFPTPATSREKWKRILLESLTFEQLSDGNRSLWIGTSVFHLFLFMVLIGHIMLISNFTLLWKYLGFENGRGDKIGSAIGGTAGLILLASAIYLLIRRFASVRVREISGVEDYASIVLILAVVISGDFVRFSSNFDPASVREFCSGLVGLRITAIPRDPCFLLHLFLAQVLIMYIPFSKFLHIPGVFYTKSVLYQS